MQKEGMDTKRGNREIEKQWRRQVTGRPENKKKRD